MVYGDEQSEKSARRITARQIRRMKKRGEPVVSLTAYDFPTARLVEEAGIDLILVGDSLGMVVLGYDSTLPVTLADMIHHAKPVVRATSRALIVVDMPFMSYQASVADAVRSAGRLIKETGAQAVKLEGGGTFAEAVARIVESGIPVMGHIGLTPQSVNQLGGYRVVGKSRRAAELLLADARALEEAGVFSIVLEAVPEQLAGLISQSVAVPTIGIGAGAGCDGQIQVLHDIIGFFGDTGPRHAKRYSLVSEVIGKAVEQWRAEVLEGSFPAEEHSRRMDPIVFENVKAAHQDRSEK